MARTVAPRWPRSAGVRKLVKFVLEVVLVYVVMMADLVFAFKTCRRLNCATLWVTFVTVLFNFCWFTYCNFELFVALRTSINKTIPSLPKVSVKTQERINKHGVTTMGLVHKLGIDTLLITMAFISLTLSSISYRAMVHPRDPSISDGTIKGTFCIIIANGVIGLHDMWVWYRDMKEVEKQLADWKGQCLVAQQDRDTKEAALEEAKQKLDENKIRINILKATIDKQSSPPAVAASASR